MVWVVVREAQEVINKDAVTTSWFKVQRGSTSWKHKVLQRVSGFSMSSTSNLFSILPLKTTF